MKKLQPVLNFNKAQKWAKPIYGEVTFPNVGTLRGLGDKILEMCRFVQKDMGRLVTFTAL